MTPEQLQKAVDFAKQNPGDPRAKELRRRIEQGLLNPELKSAGYPTVELPQQKKQRDRIAKQIDVQGTIDTYAQPNAPQSKPSPYQNPESRNDVQETGTALLDTAKNTYQGVKDIATDDDYNLAQKFTGILGKLAGGTSAAIGDVVTGAGKIVLSQNAEDKIKQITANIAQGISETEAAKSVAEWYGGLNKEDKLLVDSVGGMAALMADLFTGGVASKVAKPIVEGTIDATESAIKTTIDVGGQALDATNQVIKEGARTIDNVFRTSDEALEKKIGDLYTRSVKPTVRGMKTSSDLERAQAQQIEAIRTISKNKDNLTFYDDVGQAITGRSPESLHEFSQAIEQTKANVYRDYNALAKAAGQQGLQIDTKAIASELDTVLNNKAIQLTNPDAIRYAEAVKDRYTKAGNLTAEEAEEVIKNYNNSLQSFYKNPTPEGLTRNAVDALMVNQIRQKLDDGIMNLTGEEYQALKNQYGALKSIEKDVLNATLRDARKNVKGLIDYTDIFTGSQLVGALTEPTSAIKAGTMFGIKEYFKYLNDPNRQIKKMFELQSKLDTPAQPGMLEQSIDNASAGMMSIRPTVTPEAVARKIDKGDVKIIARFLDGNTEGSEGMLKAMKIDKADEATQKRFLREVLDIYDQGPQEQLVA